MAATDTDDITAEPEPTGNYPTAHETYIAAGWPSVLPLPPKQKTPPPRGCTGAEGRWPSAADVFDWSHTQPADCNIALRVPPDIIGLDVDQYGSKRGRDNLAEAAATHRLPELPPTWSCSARDGTDSGIYFYRVPDGTRLRGEAVPDVETIQHHHRYAVVWPSVHPKGMPYRWRSPNGLPAVNVPDFEDLAELPPAWIDFLADRVPDPLPAELPAAVEHRETIWAGAVQEDYQRARAALLTAAPGSRHEIARDRSMALCRHEQNGLAGATAALDLLGDDFLNAVVLDRDTPEQARAEWARMLAGGRLLAQRTITAAQAARERAQTDTAALLPPTPPEAPTEPLSGRCGNCEGVDPASCAVCSPPSVPDPCEPALIRWDAFWAADTDGADYLAEPLLARGRGHALYATAKLGKSLLVLEVAAALATGRPVLSQPASEPLDVVYLDLEMTADDIRERLEDFGYTPDDDLSRLHYYLLPQLPPLDTPEGGAVLEHIATLRNARLVVIDTMSRVVAGEENDAGTYQDFYRHTGIRLKRLGVTYIRLDHAGKDVDRGQRGSSAKADDVDVVWRATPTEHGIRLKATHRRMSWIAENVALGRRQTPTLRHIPTATSSPPGTSQLAQTMDELRIPLEATQREAEAMIRAAGMQARTAKVGAALRYRREQRERREAQIGPLPPL